MSLKTKVGKYLVPVIEHEYYSIVSFSSGDKGERERGDYAFWTAVFRKPVGKRKLITGRARIHLPPGDRVDRMRVEMRSASSHEDRKAYADFWNNLGGGKNILHIRPSTLEEINRWTDSHHSDSIFIKWSSVGGVVSMPKIVLQANPL